MSNRLTKGIARVGSLASDKPGIKFGKGIHFKSSGSTVEVVTSYKFPENAFISNMYVRILSASATSPTISIGLATASSSTLYNGFVSALPVGSTSFPNLAPNAGTTTYFGCLLSSTGTQTKVDFAIGSCSTGAGAAGTSTMRYLSYSVASTEAVTATVTPIFFELE